MLSMDIRCKGGTTISVKTVISGVGTQTYDVGANLTRLY
jgi:hypothetical protein